MAGSNAKQADDQLVTNVEQSNIFLPSPIENSFRTFKPLCIKTMMRALPFRF